MDPVTTILLTVGAAIVALLAVTWLVRPALARMGVGYAMHRKQQAALITAGLMVATTIIAAAGIAADSSGRSFTESLLGRLELTDVILDATYGQQRLSAAEAERFASDSRLPRPEAWALALRSELPFEDVQSGLGDVRVPVWGIDPETFGRVGRFQAVAGNVPVGLDGWQEGHAVANEAAARQYGIVVGDAARVYSSGAEVLTQVATPFDGHLVLASWNELPPGAPEPEAAVHHPDDVYRFTYNTTRQVSWMPISFELESPDAQTEFRLTVRAVGGDAHTVGPATAPLNITVPADASHQTQWDIRVDSPLAQDVPFRVVVREHQRAVLPDKELPLTISAIVQQQGSEPLRGGPAVYLPAPVLQGFLEQSGMYNLLLIDYPAGEDLEALDDELEAVRSDIWRGGVQVHNDRADLERERADIEDAVRFTFLGIGSFSILAGFMLIGVMMALLVEERKRILATSRAIGAQRSALTVAHAHEGSVYSLAAGIAGFLGALLLASALAGPLRSIFQAEGAEFVLVLHPATAFMAVGAGFALTMLAIILSAHSASRFHIAAALKGEEQETRGARRWGLAVAVLLAGGGAFLTAAGVGGSAWAAVLGPCVLGIGAAGVAARFIGRNAGYAGAALLLSAFLIGSFWWIDASDDDSEFLLYPLRGVLLSISIGVAAAYSTKAHAAVVWAAQRAGRAGAYVEAALAHLRQRPGRAALTISMFATVLVVLTALGTLFATFQPSGLGDTGGFDVLSDSRLDLGDPAVYLQEHPPATDADPLAMSARWVATPLVPDGVGALSIVVARDNGFSGTGPYIPAGSQQAYAAAAPTPAFIDEQSFAAGDMRSGLVGIQAALRAVMAEPLSVVVTDQMQYCSPVGGGCRPVRVGDSFVVGPWGDDATQVQVIGLLRDARSVGVFVHPETLQILAEDVGLRQPGTRIWADPAPGVSDTELARSFESAFRRAAAVAVAADHVEDEEAAIAGAFQTMISLFMGLGIVIGMVSLALVMGRNVLIRRAEIGTLRAIGASPQGILGMFSVEALYVSLTSIGIGLGVGVLLAWAMVRTDAIFVPLRIDWGALLVLYGVTLLAAVAAAFVPAWRASRIPPAQAVRYNE